MASPVIITHCPLCLSRSIKRYLAHEAGTIMRCRQCKGMFTQERFNEFDLEQGLSASVQIGTEYNKLISETRNVNQQIAREIIGFIMKYLAKSGNFLEIGCGSCAIGELIHNDYPDIRYKGIEGASQFYETIKPEIRHQVIFEKDLFKALENIPESSQNVVILNHVLEHLPYPKEIMKTVRTKLSPGGGMYVEVPNEQWKRSLISVRSILKPSEHPWFPGHINFFTRENLKNFVYNQEMKILLLEKGTAGENLPTVIKMLGGEKAFEANHLARGVYQLLKLTHFEKIIDYGIILRCVCGID